MADSFEDAALVDRLRGPLPSVYVPFGDDGDMAWDGVLSRERQLRERLEAADEIERLRRAGDSLAKLVRLFVNEDTDAVAFYILDEWERAK